MRMVTRAGIGMDAVQNAIGAGDDDHRAVRLGSMLVTASAVAYSTAGFFTRLIDLDVATILFWRGLFAGVFMLVMLSSVGLPGLNGFVGEFLVLIGTFISRRWWAVVAATGVILAAVYLLWAYQRVFHGVPEGDNLKFPELRWREGAVLAPVLALIIFLGVYPKPVLDRMAPSVRTLVQRVDQGTGAHPPAGAAEGKRP